MIVTHNERLEEYTVHMDGIEYELFRDWIRAHRDSLRPVRHDPAAKPFFEFLDQLNHELHLPRPR